MKTDYKKEDNLSITQSPKEFSAYRQTSIDHLMHKFNTLFHILLGIKGFHTDLSSRVNIQEFLFCFYFTLTLVINYKNPVI